jgi:hypothetical protein
MTLVQSWVDSLSLLKPKNLQLFAMVTIKSIIEAYKLYFKYFWWLLLVFIGLFFIAPDYVVSLASYDRDSITSYARIMGISRILYGLLFLGACFITRPSVLQKDCAYLRVQYKKIIIYWLMWIVLMLVLSICMAFVPLFLVSSNMSWYIFFVLFFADSAGGAKNLFLSMWKAFKMSLYNYPLLIVMGFVFGIPVVIFNYVFFITPLMQNLVSALLLPIGVCTYTNVYIKKLHDQFDLYFNKPQ